MRKFQVDFQLCWSVKYICYLNPILSTTGFLNKMSNVIPMHYFSVLYNVLKCCQNGVRKCKFRQNESYSIMGVIFYNIQFGFQSIYTLDWTGDYCILYITPLCFHLMHCVLLDRCINDKRTRYGSILTFNKNIKN